MTHGKAEAKQKKFAQAAVEGVDAIIQGHTHDGLIRKNARMVFNSRNRIRVKSTISITASSWLKYGGYAARAQCLPVAVGAPQCLLLDFIGTNRESGEISVVW